jgi:alkylation response protein AidB-like acyl-CoA dehydrogenase
LIPPDAKGVSIVDLEHSGLRYAASTDVTFDDVAVPIANVLGGDRGWNDGWRRLAGRALDVEKLEISAVALGMAGGAVEEAVRYAGERRQFGKTIGAHQAVRHTLADVRCELEACRLMLYHAAWLAQEGKPCALETSMAKLFIGERALQIALRCQQVLGAYGSTPEFGVEQHVRDLSLMPIVGGSSNMQRNNVAARLGLPNE